MKQPIKRGDLCSQYQSHCEEREKLVPIPLEEYHDWLPVVERKAFVAMCFRLSPASLQVPIRCCYQWRVRVTDKRQASMIGVDGRTVTGVKLWPLMVGDVKDCMVGVHPIVALPGESKDEEDAAAKEEENADAAEEDADAEEALVLTASALNTSLCEYLGWRTSYRKSQPENYNAAEPSVRRMLAKKNKIMATTRQQMQRNAARHRPVKKRDNTQRVATQKARAAALKARRIIR